MCERVGSYSYAVLYSNLGQSQMMQFSTTRVFVRLSVCLFEYVRSTGRNNIWNLIMLWHMIVQETGWKPIVFGRIRAKIKVEVTENMKITFLAIAQEVFEIETSSWHYIGGFIVALLLTYKRPSKGW